MVIRKTIESQTFLALSTPLCAIFSIVIIGLVGRQIDYTTSNGAKYDSTQIAWNVTVNDTVVSQNKTIRYLPEDVRLGSYWLMLAAGIVGFLDAIALIAMLLWRKANVWRAENRSGRMQDINRWPQTPIALFLALLGFLFSLAATIYSWVDWAESGKFDPSDDIATRSGRYAAYQGFFTPDAWNCQFEDYIVNKNTQNRIENLCTQGTATRTVTLALCVVSFCVLVSLSYRIWLRARGQGPSFAGAGVFPVSEEERGRSRDRDRSARTLGPEDEKADLGARGREANEPAKPALEG